VERNEIRIKEKIAENTYSFWFYHPEIAKHFSAGQFLILRVVKEGERIPLTIADVDIEKKLVRIIFQVVGETTYLLSKLNVNDIILDVLGPLGHGFEIPDGTKSVLLVGGGLGIAPLFPKIKEISINHKLKADVILGARSKDLFILVDEISKIASNVYLFTDDGSSGHKGLVTDGINFAISNNNKYDFCIAIGPILMMKAVTELTKKLNIPTYVSLNPIMIDGTGMCGGCRFLYGNEVKFACVDGPVFNAFKVNFDDLIQRNRQYREQECQLFKGDK
jgi:ferredoxin--NADP+ reductase